MALHLPAPTQATCPSKAAFTLIELLAVVVTVVFLLAVVGGTTANSMQAVKTSSSLNSFASQISSASLTASRDNSPVIV